MLLSVADPRFLRALIDASCLSRILAFYCHFLLAFHGLINHRLQLSLLSCFNWSLVWRSSVVSGETAVVIVAVVEILILRVLIVAEITSFASVVEVYVSLLIPKSPILKTSLTEIFYILFKLIFFSSLISFYTLCEANMFLKKVVDSV